MPVAQQGFVITSSSQLGTGVVTSAAIADGTVASIDIADNTIVDADIAAHTTTKITVPFSLVTGTVPILQGGTGQTTAAAAMDALSPVTTRGDIIYRNATTNARLAAGTSGQFLQTQGSTADPIWASLSSTKREGQFLTDVTVSNTTTETNLFSFTLPASDMGANDILHVHINGTSWNTQGAGTVNLRCYFGATSIDLWNWTGASFTAVPGFIDFWVYAAGATNSQVLTAHMYAAGASTGGGGLAQTALHSNKTGTAAIDTTANVTVKVTFQAAVADPATNITAIDGWAVLYR